MPRYPSSQTPKMQPVRTSSPNEVETASSLPILERYEDDIPTPSNEVWKTYERQEATRSKVNSSLGTSLTRSSYEIALSHTSSLIARSQESSKKLAAESALNEVVRERERAYLRWSAESILDQRPEVIKKTIQELRNEVRHMSASGCPQHGIPQYKGRKQDGEPGVFLKKHYSEYLPSDGHHTLFLHDMRKIDPTLATALENERKRMDTFPLGTKSDLLAALSNGAFTDGHGSRKRIQDAERMRKMRVNTNISTSK